MTAKKFSLACTFSALGLFSCLARSQNGPGSTRDALIEITFEFQALPGMTPNELKSEAIAIGMKNYLSFEAYPVSAKTVIVGVHPPDLTYRASVSLLIAGAPEGLGEPLTGVQVGILVGVQRIASFIFPPVMEHNQLYQLFARYQPGDHTLRIRPGDQWSDRLAAEFIDLANEMNANLEGLSSPSQATLDLQLHLQNGRVIPVILAEGVPAIRKALRPREGAQRNPLLRPYPPSRASMICTDYAAGAND